MSEWLSIIIVILIIGIVLDGIRRARASRKNEIKLSKNARKVDQIFEREQNATFSSELPSGGARVKETPYVTEPEAQPVQASLDLNEPVPMLMDSVLEKPLADDMPLADDTHLADQESFTDEKPLAEKNESLSLDNSDGSEPVIGSLDDIDAIDEAPTDAIVTEKREVTKEKKPSLFETLSETIQAAGAQEKPEKETQPVEKNETPQEILIVNIIARQGARIPGEHLLEVFSEEKLKYGQMGIFHRHLDNDGDADVVYSVANIIEPGSFDLADIHNSETPGVCVFLTLPCAGNAITAYDDMINTTTRIAGALDCELSDENRSILTKQTIEHGRQRVVEFERKNRLKNQT